MTNKKSKFKSIYLIPIGIILLVPAFYVSFIREGNTLDRLFFFSTLIGYVLISLMVVLGDLNQKAMKKGK